MMSLKSTAASSGVSDNVKALVIPEMTLPVTFMAPLTTLVTASVKPSLFFSPMKPIGKYSCLLELYKA